MISRCSRACGDTTFKFARSDGARARAGFSETAVITIISIVGGGWKWDAGVSISLSIPIPIPVSIPISIRISTPIITLVKVIGSNHLAGIETVGIEAVGIEIVGGNCDTGVT